MQRTKKLLKLIEAICTNASRSRALWHALPMPRGMRFPLNRRIQCCSLAFCTTTPRLVGRSSRSGCTPVDMPYEPQDSTGNGGCYATLVCAANHRAAYRLDLGGSTCNHILKHGRLMMDVVCERIGQHLFHMLPLNGKAASDRRSTNLRDNLKRQRPRFRVRADLTHR